MRYSSIYLTTTIAMIFSMVSCEKVSPTIDKSEELSTDEIFVTASCETGNLETKSPVSITETTTLGLNTFKMTAYSGSTKIIDNITFTTGTPWTHDNKYYWASNADIVYSFFGTALDNAVPSTAFASISYNSGAKITISNYQISTGGGNTDLFTPSTADGTAGTYATSTFKGIYADADSNTINQSDPCIAITTGKKAAIMTVDTNSDGKADAIRMTFYHILSRVRVQAIADIASTSKVKAKFLGYEIRNVGVKGSTSAISSISSATSIAWNSSPTLGCVRDNRFTAGTTFNGSSGIDITKSSTITSVKPLDATNSWCNVIPGTYTNCQVVVKVAFYDSATGNIIGTRYFTKTQSMTFAAGNRYQFNVTVKNGGGADTDKGDQDFRLDDLIISIGSVTVTPWPTTPSTTTMTFE